MNERQIDLTTPHGRLRADIEAVRAAFANPEFKGAFDMRDWVTLDIDNVFGPDEYDLEDVARVAAAHWCGTVACLGGWFQLLGASKWDGNVHSSMAEDHCGMTREELSDLFFQWQDDAEADLELKLQLAEQFATRVEARSA